MEINLNSTILFEKNYEALNNPEIRFCINQGGSRSGKTIAICQLLIIYALTNDNKVISIIRKTFPSLRATVMRDFFSILKELNLYDKRNHNKTENIYTFHNGTIVEFFSVDDEVKIRGRKRDIAYVNEANELWYEDFNQLNLRTIDKIVCDFNPSDSISWLYDLPEEDTILIKSTYKDNPFIEKAIIQQIENLIKTDENLYKIYALGERAATKQNIFTHFKFLPSRPERFTKYIYGLDFGWSHPTALVRVYYNTTEEGLNEIYLEEVIYQSHLNSADLIKKMNDLSIEKNIEILADYSRPEMISDLQTDGFYVINADKSVQKGLNIIKTYAVYGNEKDVNLIKEYENYKYKKVREQITDEPIKLLDDACFIGETLITTKRGLVPIKNIIPLEDEVLTSNGYRRVLKLHNNGLKQVNKYSLLCDTDCLHLTSTNNHLIKTDNKWTEISQLQSGQIVTLHKPSMEKCINYTKEEDILCNTNTICTTKCGNIIMDQEKKVSIFTTLMKTLGITGLKILKKLKLQSILNFIQKIDLKTIQSGLKSFGQLVLNLQKNGIKVKKVKNGIDNTQLIVGLEKENMNQKDVNNVMKHTSQNHIIIDSVQTNVNQPIDEHQVLITKQENVNLVEQNSQHQNIQKQNFVSFIVGDTYEELVYDLEVEDVHEYFANGILVHNCDATRYACVYLYSSYFATSTVSDVFSFSR